eukprot:GDKJ01058658.1.p1 GENE.GDKJ01058658.1~~GDKJ01058658.1.p1  ORF type:complete len:631 (-),score=228.51 GDKJ01058658.1:995-2887(-)
MHPSRSKRIMINDQSSSHMIYKSQAITSNVVVPKSVGHSQDPLQQQQQNQQFVKNCFNNNTATSTSSSLDKPFFSPTPHDLYQSSQHQQQQHLKIQQQHQQDQHHQQVSPQFSHQQLHPQYVQHYINNNINNRGNTVNNSLYPSADVSSSSFFNPTSSPLPQSLHSDLASFPAFYQNSHNNNNASNTHHHLQQHHNFQTSSVHTLPLFPPAASSNAALSNSLYGDHFASSIQHSTQQHNNNNNSSNQNKSDVNAANLQNNFNMNNNSQTAMMMNAYQQRPTFPQQHSAFNVSSPSFPVPLPPHFSNNNNNNSPESSFHYSYAHHHHDYELQQQQRIQTSGMHYQTAHSVASASQSYHHHPNNAHVVSLHNRPSSEYQLGNAAMASPSLLPSPVPPFLSANKQLTSTPSAPPGGLTSTIMQTKSTSMINGMTGNHMHENVGSPQLDSMSLGQFQYSNNSNKNMNSHSNNNNNSSTNNHNNVYRMSSTNMRGTQSENDFPLLTPSLSTPPPPRIQNFLQNEKKIFNSKGDQETIQNTHNNNNNNMLYNRNEESVAWSAPPTRPPVLYNNNNNTNNKSKTINSSHTSPIQFQQQQQQQQQQRQSTHTVLGSSISALPLINDLPGPAHSLHYLG